MNRPVILYHRSTGRTARMLSEVLHLDRAKAVDPYTPVVIRWGSSTPAVLDFAINTRQSIALTSHGLNSLQVMEEAGVPVPTVWTRPPTVEELYPILARTINHRGGMDILWCENHAEAVGTGRGFFTRYTKVDHEFRVHVFGGEVLRVFRKVKRESDADNLIRTSYRGWGYSRVTESSIGESGVSVSLNAISALGLAFGAVDLGYNSETGKFVVFEANTGPSLNSVSLLYYAREFENYLLGLEGVGYESTGVCWAEEIGKKVAGGDSQ